MTRFEKTNVISASFQKSLCKFDFACKTKKNQVRKNSRGFLVVLFIAVSNFLFSSVFSQTPFYAHYNSDSISKIHLSDSVLKKRFGRGAWNLMVSEATPLLFDRYIHNEDYARISFQTVASNFKLSSWTFDNDPFVTNQFGHPFHGSLFFNSLRTNGYSFWQSLPATFVGSYLWETVAENQPPAPNDFINTGFGGFVLGEITYRLANKIINNRTTGIRRQISEIAALLINPVNGLNRIIDGKWGRMSGNTMERDSSRIYAEFDVGARRFKINNTDLNLGAYGHMKLLYGTPYENYKTPFSYIYINTEFGSNDSSRANIVSVYGSLTGWLLQSSEKARHLLLLTANYDFILNRAFFYSSQNMKLNLFSEFNLTNKVKINTSVAGGIIVLAAVPDVYITPDGRNYDYCSGAAFSGNFGISLADHFFYTINYKGAWLKTINGNESHYLLHTVTSELRYMILNGLSICAEPGYFTLLGRYKNFPEVNKTYPYLRASVRYSINIQ